MENNEALVGQLREYARQQVSANRDNIEANLRGKDLPLVLDVALPGAGFFSVAAGGLAEVLHLLGPDIIQVDRFIGASGGACSLFLIVANALSSQSARSTSDDARQCDIDSFWPGLTDCFKGQPHEDVESTASSKSFTSPSSNKLDWISRQGSGRQCPDSSLLLRSYLEYGESEGAGSFARGLSSIKQGFSGISAFWEVKYRQLLQDEKAFNAIRESAFVAICAKPMASMLRNKATKAQVALTEARLAKDSDAPSSFEAMSDNYVFHNFSNREQAVQSFVASGEATYKGMANGINVLHACEGDVPAPQVACMRILDESGKKCSAPLALPTHYCDGGAPVCFRRLPSSSPPSRSGAGNKSKNGFLFYHTFYSNPQDGFIVTPQSVERLFKQAVDRTIDCLLCEKLYSPQPGCWSASDKMVIVLPDSDPMTDLAKIGKGDVGKKDGIFVNLRTGDMFEV
jgi:hypothetical protein